VEPAQLFLKALLRIMHLTSQLIPLHDHVLLRPCLLVVHDALISLLLEHTTLFTVFCVEQHHLLAVLLRQCQVMLLNLLFHL